MEGKQVKVTVTMKKQKHSGADKITRKKDFIHDLGAGWDQNDPNKYNYLGNAAAKNNPEIKKYIDNMKNDGWELESVEHTGDDLNVKNHEEKTEKGWYKEPTKKDVNTLVKNMVNLSDKDKQFAQSLIDGFKKYHKLSDKQWQWVDILSKRNAK